MWIKVCGIRDQATATAVAAFAPDAIGLNFYEGSPRKIENRVAAEVAASLPSRIESVGLFVNEIADAIHKTCVQCELRTIQLHGDEPPEMVRKLAECDREYRVIRVWNLGDDGLEELGDYLGRLAEWDVSPVACLIDARVPGKHGGTGKQVDWELLNREYNRDDWPPLILAGGLTPENVADAIHAVQPWGVDVASGVESAPGVKDLSLVERFIQAARDAGNTTN